MRLRLITILFFAISASMTFGQRASSAGTATPTGKPADLNLPEINWDYNSNLKTITIDFKSAISSDDINEINIFEIAGNKIQSYTIEPSSYRKTKVIYNVNHIESLHFKDSSFFIYSCKFLVRNIMYYAFQF